MPDLEKTIKCLECCIGSDDCAGHTCPYWDFDDSDVGCRTQMELDALALLKEQEIVRCNKCRYYEGVHNIAGHAPCSFWNIGGVLYSDYCSRFENA